MRSNLLFHDLVCDDFWLYDRLCLADLVNMGRNQRRVGPARVNESHLNLWRIMEGPELAGETFMEGVDRGFGCSVVNHTVHR